MVKGYTSEPPVHRVTQYYSSWFIHLLILLLDVLGSILYTLRRRRELSTAMHYKEISIYTYMYCLKGSIVCCCGYEISRDLEANIAKEGV